MFAMSPASAIKSSVDDTIDALPGAKPPIGAVMAPTGLLAFVLQAAANFFKKPSVELKAADVAAARWDGSHWKEIRNQCGAWM